MWHTAEDGVCQGAKEVSGHRSRGLQLRSPEQRCGDRGGAGSEAVCGGNAAAACVLWRSARPLAIPCTRGEHAVKDRSGVCRFSRGSGGVTAGYMVGPEEMGDRKGLCPMMVTVEVKVGEPVEDEDEERESD